MSRFVFIVNTDGILEGWIDYRPDDSFDAAKGDLERFYTLNAAKAYLKARWKGDIDHLRANLEDLKKVRRDDLVRAGRKQARGAK